MRKALVLFLAFLPAPAWAQDAAPGERAVLDAFFAAFNAHDVEAMTQYVTGDIEVVYLDDAGVADRSDGVDALTVSMRGYFESLPSARAEIVDVIIDGERLAVRERAFWSTGEGEARSQTSLSVYRFEGGLIASVWYFPETRDTD